ncbi:phosphatidylinositol kinase [Arthrobacter sp. ERGS1:01]|uniref:SCO1664 family protein n=1 Tax=Arthrobacter sp. ERGS1:01 TaxID=1704044 RepID=UPI0006B54C2A|nr:SCO1664 family protein [Arthrobacter sp. ERGS1:01]ALE05758.1 phosphatidylinositol kinase [Arthrobacter sp. ERGS1:01]
MPGRKLTLLSEGRIELAGRIEHSSNASYLAQISLGEDAAWAVYKPESGERPLFDFEPGLHRRERAAYLLSKHLGWGIVPPTVIREDAPLGVGSLQWFIEGDGREHYFTLYDDAPETHPELVRIAVFDCIANNTDRKSGHVVRGRNGRVWGIDHGLCFAAEFKLRTVIWDFAGDPIPGALLADIAPIAEAVPDDLAELLDGAEVTALRRRAERLLRQGVLPIDRTGRRYPWPLV